MDKPIKETVGCDDDQCPCYICKIGRGESVHANKEQCIGAGDHFVRICTDGYCTMCGQAYTGDETVDDEEDDEEEDEEDEEEDEEDNPCMCSECVRERQREVGVSLLRLTRLMRRRSVGKTPMEDGYDNEEAVFSLDDLSSLGSYNEFEQFSFIDHFVKLPIYPGDDDSSARAYEFIWVEVTEVVGGVTLVGKVISCGPRADLVVGDEVLFTRDEVLDVWIDRDTVQGLDPVLIQSKKGSDSVNRTYDYINRIRASHGCVPLGAFECGIIWRKLSDQEKLCIVKYSEFLERKAARDSGQPAERVAEISAVG